MKKRTCETCEEYELLRLRAARSRIRVEKERPIAFICENCGDTKPTWRFYITINKINVKFPQPELSHRRMSCNYGVDM
jgi:RNase P subunit RPR2